MGQSPTLHEAAERMPPIDRLLLVIAAVLGQGGERREAFIIAAKEQFPMGMGERGYDNPPSRSDGVKETALKFA